MLYALCNFLQKLSKLHKLAVVKHQLKRFSAKFLPSKNHLARNIHILQVFFLQNLQDLAQNLASLALKMKFFLQDLNNLARFLQENFCKILFLQDLDQILQENYLTILSCKILARCFVSCKKSFIFSARLARYVQDLVQDLASLARKKLARFAYFLQDSFYWVVKRLIRKKPRCYNKARRTKRSTDWAEYKSI